MAAPLRAATFVSDISFYVEAPEDTKPKGKFTFTTFSFCSTNDKWLLVIALLLTGITGAGMPLFSYFFGDLINVLGGAEVENAHEPAYYALLLTYIGIGVFACMGIGAACYEWVGENVVRRVRYEYLRAVLRQEMSWFDQFDAGTLSSRLSQNCIFMRDGISLKLGQLGQALVQFIAGYILGFLRSWRMTLVLTSTLPLILICGAAMSVLMGSSLKTAQKQYSTAGSVAEEVLAAIRTVVSFGAEERSAQRYERRAYRAAQAGVRSGLWQGLGMGVTIFIVFASYSLGFWYGGKLIVGEINRNCTGGGCFNGGKALSVFFCVVFGAFSLGQAGPPYAAFTLAGTASEDLLSLTSRESEINPEDETGLKDVELKGEIELKDVKFAYPTRQETPVFQKVNLKIRAGETVALVGPSGCGKSTTVQLVQRFYNPVEGEVLLDGRPIPDYNLKWLRDQMSLVSQEPRLFARSIAENIRDGRENATLSEIEEAAKNANAMGFISMFPEGLDTFVGEGGSQLSGGQKQRIAIARAMLRDPAVLILDEATSALDNQSERVVQETLDRLVAAKKRTTIIIAHRLSTIRNADRIIVFDNVNGEGSVVAEEGTHDELMAIADGLYKALVNAQALGVGPAVKRGSSDVSASARAGRNSSSMMRLEQLLHTPGQKRDSTAGEIEMAALLGVEAMVVDDVVIKPPGYFRVMRLLGNQWKALAVALVASMGAGLLFPMYAVLFAEFVGVYFRPTPDEILDGSIEYALWFLLLAGGGLIAFFFQKYAGEYVGSHVIYNLRKALFRKMVYNEIGWFDAPEHSTGALSQVLASDALLIKGWTGDNFCILVQNISSLISGIVIAFLAQPKLAAVCLASFCAIVPAVMIETRIMQGGDKDLEGEAQTAGFMMNEAITNIRIVTAYNLQDRLLRNFSTILNADLRSGHRRAIIGGIFYGFSQGLQFFANALQLWYGQKLIVEGEIDNVSKMLRASLALMLAGIGIGQTMVFVTDSTKARAAAARMYAVLDRPSKIDASRDSGKVVTANESQGFLNIKSVRFAYPLRPEIQIYKSVSFDVKPGQTVALVGASGCGKSTIIQMLQRFYDVHPDSGGMVCLDNDDIRTLHLKSLRKLMGLVGQEPVLFNTTIADNIRYGKPDATMEEIEEAARSANAIDFIRAFPEGFDQGVGKGGSQLSGGQKQRIAIARAIVRNPKILLLDEATSALDSESERVVQEALDKLMQSGSRTTLVIAHRLSTIKGADKIVVFANPDNEGSAIVEEGTHAELLQAPTGVYRGLVQATERVARKHE